MMLWTWQWRVHYKYDEKEVEVIMDIKREEGGEDEGG